MSYALLAYLADGEVGVANMFIGGKQRAEAGGETSTGARVMKIQEGETSMLDTLGLTVIDRITGACGYFHVYWSGLRLIAHYCCRCERVH